MNPTDKPLTPSRSELPHLESVDLQREIYYEGCYLRGLALTFRNPHSDMNVRRFVMKCKGVRDLRFGRLDGLFTLVVECRSIKDRQLEDL